MRNSDSGVTMLTMWWRLPGASAIQRGWRVRTIQAEKWLALKTDGPENKLKAIFQDHYLKIKKEAIQNPDFSSQKEQIGQRTYERATPILCLVKLSSLSHDSGLIPISPRNAGMSLLWTPDKEMPCRDGDCSVISSEIYCPFQYVFVFVFRG